VLVLEDDRTCSAVVSLAIRRGLPGCLVLIAGSLEEARQILADYRFHFFVIDLRLPDGCGIEFINDIQSHEPEAGVVVVSGTQLPEYRQQVMALGVLTFLEKPVDREKLLSAIKAYHEQKFVPSLSGQTTSFSASLVRLATLEIIQLKCLSGATTAVDFISRQHGVGRVYFQDGEIIHAKTQSRSGLGALSEIVGWRGGQAVEIGDAKPAGRSIQGNWQNLLMNAAQSADEGRQESHPQAKA
jgi:DNA-binding NarL/FixJ family response regulator